MISPKVVRKIRMGFDHLRNIRVIVGTVFVQTLKVVAVGTRIIILLQHFNYTALSQSELNIPFMCMIHLIWRSSLLCRCSFVELETKRINVFSRIFETKRKWCMPRIGSTVNFDIGGKRLKIIDGKTGDL